MSTKIEFDEEEKSISLIKRDFTKISDINLSKDEIRCLSNSVYSWIINFSGSPIEMIERIYKQNIELDDSYYTNIICCVSRAFIKMIKNEQLDYNSKQLIKDRQVILAVSEPEYEKVIIAGQQMDIEKYYSSKISLNDIIEWKFGIDVLDEFYLYINR